MNLFLFISKLHKLLFFFFPNILNDLRIFLDYLNHGRSWVWLSSCLNWASAFHKRFRWNLVSVWLSCIRINFPQRHSHRLQGLPHDDYCNFSGGERMYNLCVHVQELHQSGEPTNTRKHKQKWKWARIQGNNDLTLQLKIFTSKQSSPSRYFESADLIGQKLSTKTITFFFLCHC